LLSGTAVGIRLSQGKQLTEHAAPGIYKDGIQAAVLRPRAAVCAS
jgi:hypothetical protein